MVWRKMLLYEFQDVYLVDSHLLYLNGMIEAILDLHFALKTTIILCSRENMGWKILFEKFQECCLVHGQF